MKELKRIRIEEVGHIEELPIEWQLLGITDRDQDSPIKNSQRYKDSIESRPKYFVDTIASRIVTRPFGNGHSPTRESQFYVKGADGDYDLLM